MHHVVIIILSAVDGVVTALVAILSRLLIRVRSERDEMMRRAVAKQHSAN
jgi:hypothetical protein